MRAGAPLLRRDSVRGAGIAGVCRGARRHDGSVLAEALHAGEDERGRREEEGGSVVSARGGAAHPFPESSPLQFSMATPRRCLQTSAQRMVVEVEAPKMCPVFASLMMDQVIKGLMTCPHAVLCQSLLFQCRTGCWRWMQCSCSAEHCEVPIPLGHLPFYASCEKCQSRTRVRKCCRTARPHRVLTAS